jgi:hypothetical protein
MSDWHDGCDDHISFTVTTPPLATITASYNPNFCSNLVTWCASGSSEVERCDTAYSAHAERSSCLCAPELLSLEYSCLYVGNVSCVQTSAALSNIAAYNYCSNFQSVIGNLPNVRQDPDNAMYEMKNSPGRRLQLIPLTGATFKQLRCPLR